jgi:hypothetical protein
MAAEFLNPFLAMGFVLLQVCRSEKSVLPVHSGCLDLDAHFKQHNVKLASVYIECRMQVHDMSRPSLLRARSTHLFAQLSPYKGLA